MTKALNKAKKLNYEAVVADTYARNFPLQNLLEKFGF